MPGTMDRDQEIREAARALVDSVAKTHVIYKLDDFHCGFMRKLASLVGFTCSRSGPIVRNGQWIAQVGDRFRPTFNAYYTTGPVIVTAVREGFYYLVVDEFGQRANYVLASDLWEPV